MKVRTAVAIAGLLALAACNSKEHPVAAASPSRSVLAVSPSPSAATCTTKAAEYTDTFQSRNIVVALPAPSTKPRPVVIALHGYNGEAQDFASYTGLSTRAPAAGVVMLSPQGVITSAGGPGWNFERSSAIGPDDVAFLDAMLDHYRSSLCLDLTHVVVTGWSDGADMAITFACHSSHSLRGGLAVAAATAADTGCKVRSMTLVNGTADPIEPYNGGSLDPRPGYGSIRSLSAQAITDSFAKQLGCTGTAPGPQGNGFGTQLRTPCAKGGTVTLVTVLGGGHPWPSATYDADAQLGPTNHTYDTTGAVLALTH